MPPPRAPRRGFATLAVLTAGALLFSSTATGVAFLAEGVRSGLEGIARRPSGAFTQDPTHPFLGDAGLVVNVDPALVFTHALAVAAEPGAASPWEGSADGVNTGNGDRLTQIHLLDWKVRGGMSLDLTLYHNSQSGYSDEQIGRAHV